MDPGEQSGAYPLIARPPQILSALRAGRSGGEGAQPEPLQSFASVGFREADWLFRAARRRRLQLTARSLPAFGECRYCGLKVRIARLSCIGLLGRLYQGSNNAFG